MKVFLDTNVFYNNWFANNANFRLLFYFLNNEKYDLLLSELVVQETNNIRNRELEEVKSELARLIKKGSKLNQKSLDLSLDSLGIEAYDLASILDYKVDCIENINYETIQQNTVVDRAIKTVKPFSGQEKGYRDTLIWLSFLHYLKDNNIEGDVAFITNNKSDFLVGKADVLKFNNDLLKDIIELGIKAKIKPYLNIYDFVDENVDKISHSFDRDEIIDDLEDFLVEETESFLRNMNNGEIDDLLQTRIFSSKLTPVIDIEPDIFEGIEDPCVKGVRRLSGSSVYISSYFEMRRVDFVVTIDKVEFDQHVDEIEVINSLYNIEIDGNFVKLSFILRTGIEGSFEFETKNRDASSFSVEKIHDKQRSR